MLLLLNGIAALRSHPIKCMALLHSVYRTADVARNFDDVPPQDIHSKALHAAPCSITQTALETHTQTLDPSTRTPHLGVLTSACVEVSVCVTEKV